MFKFPMVLSRAQLTTIALAALAAQTKAMAPIAFERRATRAAL